jgi:cobalamin biosynthesis Mg chelatase CobN
VSERKGGINPGLGVDAQGNPVLDPTKNVLDLVEAAIQRQDDLREAESRHVRETSRAEASHVREIAALRAEYQAELRSAEIERIDAIRAVDVAAIQQSRSEAETRATALANQVQASAEAMRNQVAAAASAAATSLAQALEPVQKDIADLRRAQYEAQGQKTQVVESRAGLSGTTAIIGAVVALAFVGISLFFGFRNGQAETPPPAPVIVTVPKQTP